MRPRLRKTPRLPPHEPMKLVNLDEELTLLLDIEQSYKAATKILNAVDEMLKALLDIAS
jgi:flagellar hook-associated protein FlgK